jgi:HAD superfamily hydrolase (TIGR01549 family)
MASVVVFDLDETLLDTSALRTARDSRSWHDVANRLDEAKDYKVGESNIEVSELPSILRVAGYRVGVITHSPSWYATKLMDAFDIHVEALITGTDPYARKPDPSSLRAIATELGSIPEDTIFVGDSSSDFGAAANAGAGSVGACWSRETPSDWRRHWPDVALSDPDRLLDAIAAPREMGPYAEAAVNGMKVRWHWGSVIRLGEHTYAGGRYYPIADRRHASQRLSQLILDAKQDPKAATLMGELLADMGEHYLRRGNAFDAIASVPSKPSDDRDRFEVVRAQLASRLGTRPGGNLLRMLHDIEGYKHLDHTARAVANEGRFEANALDGERVLLVDDVLTSETGGQVETCRRKLLEAGASEVTIIGLAVTQESMNKLCPECGGVLLVKTGAHGRFVGCSNWRPRGCQFKEDLP